MVPYHVRFVPVVILVPPEGLHCHGPPQEFLLVQGAASTLDPSWTLLEAVFTLGRGSGGASRAAWHCFLLLDIKIKIRDFNPGTPENTLCSTISICTERERHGACLSSFWCAHYLHSSKGWCKPLMSLGVQSAENMLGCCSLHMTYGHPQWVSKAATLSGSCLLPGAK